MNKLAALITLGLSFQAVAAIDTTFFAPLDVHRLHQQEVRNARKGEAPRFAVPQVVRIAPTWEKTGNTYKWIHNVKAPNAVSLNFGFTKFCLPRGATLNIYSADRTKFIRAFTAKDNNRQKQLWTPVIMSDAAVIEVTAPESVVKQVQLELGHVGQGFRTFSEGTRRESGSCNYDVSCTESKGWENEINSVGVISTGGSTFCTGFMVNNTNNDKKPLFITAAHCRINAGNAASLVVYWNYQTSKCRGPRDGKLTDFQSGAVHLASSSKSDFTLVQLNQSPDPKWNVSFAGWDATANIGTKAVAIHHPNTDEKSISFENDPTELSSYGGSSSPGDGTHVRVVDWDLGTTEPGSSGSPLFDENHRVIGQLHGGRAACGNNESDYYGRFHTSWTGDGSKTTRLKDHLDPANTGKLTTDTL